MSIDFDKAKKLLAASGSLGAGTVLKAIGKFIPGVGQFATGAYTAGYAADQILDFVKDKLENPSSRRNKQQLESRAEQGIARSDENAALSQMNQQSSPFNALSGAAKLGAQAAGGVASARAGSEQQAQEQELAQQRMQLQESEQQQRQQQQEQQIAQRQQQQEQNQVRQSQQDQLATIRRQQEDIQRKEQAEFKKRAEERSIEKHQKSMNKPMVQSALKKPIPQNHGDVLKELHDLINRLP